MAGKTNTSKKGSSKKTAARRTTPVKAKVSAAHKTAPSAKQAKPVFRAGTWITILVLAVLVGFTVYLNREKEPAVTEETPVSEPLPVFTETDGAPSSIEIKPANADGETVRIARNAENVWAIVLPIEAEADQGLAEAAAAQISALQVISPVDGKPSIFGFDNPAYIITIEFASGQKHTLEIGDSTPTNSGYYVRLDKDKMMITDLSGIDSLLQLGFFPPYLNTPAPTALPATETPAPTSEVTVTPTP